MEYLWLCLAAAAAGAVNAVAGGGTLLTFPTLAGVLARSPVALVVENAASFANGTSTVALFPGSLASVWGYRRQLAACKHWLVWLTPPSVLGGAYSGQPGSSKKSSWRASSYLILLAAILFRLQQPTMQQCRLKHHGYLAQTVGPNADRHRHRAVLHRRLRRLLRRRHRHPHAQLPVFPRPRRYPSDQRPEIVSGLCSEHCRRHPVRRARPGGMALRPGDGRRRDPRRLPGRPAVAALAPRLGESDGSSLPSASGWQRIISRSGD